MKQTTTIIVAVAATGVILWFALRPLQAAIRTVAPPPPPPDPSRPITASTSIPLGSATTFLSKFTSLAGQGTSGGSTAKNPSTGGNVLTGGSGTLAAVGAWAGIAGGVIALGAAIVSINRNDTKIDREDFSKQAGFVNFDAMMRAVGFGSTDIGGKLWVEATQRIGKKDRPWNQNFLERISRALYGETVPAYMNDPTKGALPVA